MPQCTEPAGVTTESGPSKHPPSHFLCPISSECMYDPVVVTHNGFDYRFERTSLEAHAQTQYHDSNPLTNVKGFAKAAAEASTDADLQRQIRESEWAPQKPDPIVITDEEGTQQGRYEDFRVTLAGLRLRLPTVLSLLPESVWPRFNTRNEEGEIDDEFLTIVLFL